MYYVLALVAVAVLAFCAGFFFHNKIVHWFGHKTEGVEDKVKAKVKKVL